MPQVNRCCRNVKQKWFIIFIFAREEAIYRNNRNTLWSPRYIFQLLREWKGRYNIYITDSLLFSADANNMRSGNFLINIV